MAPSAEPLVHEAVAFKRHPLISHLGSHLRLSGGLGQGAGFINRASQRLFAIYMFPVLDCRHRDDCVIVVGGCHHHGIYRLFLVQHLAIVFVAFRVRILRKGLSCVIRIHVAEGNDVLALAFLQVPGALTADADPGNV